jgi:ABC-2 type transport system permease protein
MKKFLTEEQAAVRGGMQRRAKAGTYTVILSLIVLAILIAVNLLVAALPSRFITLDVTTNKMYSISEASEKAARKVREDVTIYLIRDTSQGTDTQMETFVERYAAMNSHIKLKMIDPITQPNFTAKYTANQLTNYSVIVESAKRFRVIDYGEMAYYTGGLSATADYETLMSYFQYYYAMYNEYPSLYFNGENLITSALDYVTQDDMTVAYTLAGHGETALSDTLIKQLSYNNINPAGDFTSLTATVIPDDCDILFINAPQTDLNESEAQMIVTYLQNGGNVILTTAPGIAEMPNLLSVTRAMGLDADDGLVVEQTANNYVQYPHYLIPNAEEHEITASVGEGYYMMVPLAHGITRAETVPSGTTIAPLFSTSASAYEVAIDAASIDKPADASVRSFWVGATSVNAGGGKLIWLSSAVAISDSAQSITGANYTYVSAMATWLCPRQTILETVSPISMEADTLMVPAGAALIGSGLLILAIPLGFMITGLVIWIRRRRR